MSFFTALKKELKDFVVGPDMPTKEWLDALQESKKYTPDAARLSKWATQLLFVYDGMQRGHPLHNRIQPTSVYLGKAFTVFPHTLVKKKLGDSTFPIALQRRSHSSPFNRIKGELYAVHPSSTLPLTDIFLRNQEEFTRMRVHIHVPYSHLVWVKDRAAAEMLGYDFLDAEKSVLRIPGLNQVVTAWMYVGIPEYWNPLLDGGYNFGNVRAYHPKKSDKPAYSCFTAEEYKEMKKNE